MNDYVKKTISAYNKSPQKYIQRTEEMIPYHAIEKMIKYLPSGSLILDAGCAFGRDAGIFTKKGFKVVGIDLSKELLTEAQKRFPQIEFHQMDVRKLDFPNNYFDGIWCNAVLLHLKDEDIIRALKEFNRVLKKNGILCTSFKEGVGSEEKIESFSSDNSRFFNYQTRETVEKLIQEAGLISKEIYLVNERKIHGSDKRDLNWIYSFLRKQN